MTGFQFINEDFFCKVKENKGLRGGVLSYAAQASPQFDVEIAEKDHLWMETM